MLDKKTLFFLFFLYFCKTPEGEGPAKKRQAVDFENLKLCCYVLDA